MTNSRKVPGEVGSVADQGVLLRSVAVTALGAIGPFAEITVQLISEMLEREADLVRFLATRSLGQIDPSRPTEAMSIIKRLLDGDDEGIRLEAEAALGELRSR